jgi:enoyl-CoA hydratase
MADASYRAVEYTTANAVARIHLNRPDYKNAQIRVLLEELDAAFAAAESDTEINVIVLTGEGEHFSSGHDLGTPDEQADLRQRPWRKGVRGWYEKTYEIYFANTLRWRNLTKPTVAGVQGYCIFGGWMIASAMDVIVAADDAMFLGSHFQYFSMPWDLNPRKVKELLFESRFVDATEACELGLVNRVVPRADLESHVMEWAERVACNDPFLMRMAKAATNHAEETQGFTAHATAAHAFYTLARLGESDPDSYIADPFAKRRPMVDVAMENYKRSKQ